MRLLFLPYSFHVACSIPAFRLLFDCYPHNEPKGLPVHPTRRGKASKHFPKYQKLKNRRLSKFIRRHGDSVILHYCPFLLFGRWSGFAALSLPLLKISLFLLPPKSLFLFCPIKRKKRTGWRGYSTNPVARRSGR